MQYGRSEFSVTPGYLGHNWSMVEALRELIANALDTATRYSVRYHQSTGSVVIRDEGDGLDPSHLLFGGGEVRNASQIGQFHEGLKMAALTVASQGRKIMMHTRDWQASWGVEQSETFGCDVLVMYTSRAGTYRQGTQFTVECTHDEFLQVKELFLPFQRWYHDESIFHTPGGTEWIYVNGVRVAQAPGAFSYALRGNLAKQMQNRDRSVLDQKGLSQVLGYIWSSIPPSGLPRVVVSEMIEAMSHGSRYGNDRLPIDYELTLWNWSPQEHVQRGWVRAMDRAWGRWCISDESGDNSMTEEEHKMHANSIGYRVISSSQSDFFRKMASVKAKPLKAVIRKFYGTTSDRLIPVKELPEDIQVRWKQGRRMIRLLYPDFKGWRWRILALSDDTKWWGLTRHDQHVIDISYSVVMDANPAKLIGVMLHEVTHATTGESDNTRAFENYLSETLGRVGLLWMQKDTEMFAIEPSSNPAPLTTVEV